MENNERLGPFNIGVGMIAKTIHQCPSCERGYCAREDARNCGCPDRTIEKWECPICGSWWEPKYRTFCCGIARDGQLHKNNER